MRWCLGLLPAVLIPVSSCIVGVVNGSVAKEYPGTVTMAPFSCHMGLVLICCLASFGRRQMELHSRRSFVQVRKQQALLEIVKQQRDDAHSLRQIAESQSEALKLQKSQLQNQTTVLERQKAQLQEQTSQLEIQRDEAERLRSKADSAYIVVENSRQILASQKQQLQAQKDRLEAQASLLRRERHANRRRNRSEKKTTKLRAVDEAEESSEESDAEGSPQHVRRGSNTELSEEVEALLAAFTTGGRCAGTVQVGQRIVKAEGGLSGTVVAVKWEVGALVSTVVWDATGEQAPEKEEQPTILSAGVLVYGALVATQKTGALTYGVVVRAAEDLNSPWSTALVAWLAQGGDPVEMSASVLMGCSLNNPPGQSFHGDWVSPAGTLSINENSAALNNKSVAVTTTGGTTFVDGLVTLIVGDEMYRYFRDGSVETWRRGHLLIGMEDQDLGPVPFGARVAWVDGGENGMKGVAVRAADQGANTVTVVWDNALHERAKVARHAIRVLPGVELDGVPGEYTGTWEAVPDHRLSKWLARLVINGKHVVDAEGKSQRIKMKGAVPMLSGGILHCAGRVMYRDGSSGYRVVFNRVADDPMFLGMRVQQGQRSGTVVCVGQDAVDVVWDDCRDARLSVGRADLEYCSLEAPVDSAPPVGEWRGPPSAPEWLHVIRLAANQCTDRRGNVYPVAVRRGVVLLCDGVLTRSNHVLHWDGPDGRVTMVRDEQLSATPSEHVERLLDVLQGVRVASRCDSRASGSSGWSLAEMVEVGFGARVELDEVNGTLGTVVQVKDQSASVVWDDKKDQICQHALHDLNLAMDICEPSEGEFDGNWEAQDRKQLSRWLRNLKIVGSSVVDANGKTCSLKRVGTVTMLCGGVLTRHGSVLYRDGRSGTRAIFVLVQGS
mmetsp:Transcript_89494/g.239922  ORF Transcript_89494/g.239922 Transcript_89494/m.239922 type:complete len:894 (-) Transcript_89494:216-2897(-)